MVGHRTAQRGQITALVDFQFRPAGARQWVLRHATITVPVSPFAASVGSFSPATMLPSGDEGRLDELNARGGVADVAVDAGRYRALGEAGPFALCLALREVVQAMSGRAGPRVARDTSEFLKEIWQPAHSVPSQHEIKRSTLGAKQQAGEGRRNKRWLRPQPARHLAGLGAAARETQSHR